MSAQGVLADLSSLAHGITPDLDSSDCAHLQRELAQARATVAELIACLHGCVEHMEHSNAQGYAAWSNARAALARAGGDAP